MKLLQLLLVGLSVGIISAANFTWKHPSLCGSIIPCDYTVEGIERDDFIDFTIVAKQGPGTWTGFGLVTKNELKNVEFIWGCVNRDSYGVVLDGTLPDQYTAPTKDAAQHLKNAVATYINGYIKVTFSHPTKSEEPYELDFTDGNCFHPVVPLGGGKCLKDDGTIEKPEKTPMMPDFLVCFGESQVTGTLPTVTMETKHITGTEPTVTMESSIKHTGVTGSSVHDKTMITATEHSLGLEQYKAILHVLNEAQYRAGDAKFNLESIDPSICTHISYGHANMFENYTLIPTDPNDIEQNGGYEKLHNLKKRNADLGLILSVGGKTFNLPDFANMLKTKETRKIFIDSAIKYTRDNKFDGFCLEILNQYVDAESLLEIKDSFKSLMTELDVALTDDAKKTGKPKLLLCVVIPGIVEFIDIIDVKPISEVVDWIDVDTKMINETLLVTQLNAALFPGDKTKEEKTVSFITQHLASKGVSKKKIVIELLAMANGFKLKDPKKHDIGDAVSGLSPPGECTLVEGELSYFELCSRVRDNSNNIVFLDEEKTLYLWTQNGEWYTYDNITSLETKVDYVKDEGLGGYVLWRADLDDFSGKYCNEGTFPICRALYKTLMGSVTGSVKGSVTGSLPPLTKILERSTTLVHKMETTTIKK